MNLKKVTTFLLNHKVELVLLASTFIAYILFTLPLSFVDENDNFLTGVLMNKGLVLYKDIFSHHMPFSYYLSFIITKFTGSNLLLFRLFFCIILFVWAIGIYYIIRKYRNRFTALAFLGLLVIATPVIKSNMLVAETLVAYANITLLSLFLFKYLKKDYIFSIKDFILISIFGAIIALSSLGFVFLAAFYYFLAILLIFRRNISLKERAKQIAIGLFIMGVPYLLYLVDLLIHGTLKDFYFGAFTFNSLFYAKFQADLEPSVTQSLIHAAYRTLNSMNTVFNNFYKKDYNIHFLELLGIGTLIVYYFRRNQLLKILLIVGVFFIVNIREGGIGSPWGYEFHGLAYSVLILFLIAVIADIVYRAFKVNNLNQKVFLVMSVALVGFLALTSTGFIAQDINLYNGILFNQNPRVKSSQTYPSKVINDLLTEDDYAWIGPFENFQSEATLKTKIASKYTFWLPWQEACDKCANEFLRDLQQNKPKVIYWESIEELWGYKDVESRPFKYISEHYFSINNSALKNFYFLNEDRNQIIPKLAQHKYI